MHIYERCVEMFVLVSSSAANFEVIKMDPTTRHVGSHSKFQW